MMRLIDADELLKYIEETNTEREWVVNKYNADWIWSFIDSAPTIDAEPVRHGYWETLLNGNIQCSQCGHEPYWDSDDWKLNCGSPYYCPNCGAKMDGKEDNK